MSSQRLKPIATAILLGGLSTTTLSALALAADVYQQSTATPDRSAFQGEEEVISSAGAKVLRHIARARNYVHRGPLRRSCRRRPRCSRASIGPCPPP
jgi:hypothetical protein